MIEVFYTFDCVETLEVKFSNTVLFIRAIFLGQKYFS